MEAARCEIEEKEHKKWKLNFSSNIAVFDSQEPHQKNELTFAGCRESPNFAILTASELISRCHSHLIYRRGRQCIQLVGFCVKHRIRLISWNCQRIPQKTVLSLSTKVLVTSRNASKSKCIVDNWRQGLRLPRN